MYLSYCHLQYSDVYHCYYTTGSSLLSRSSKISQNMIANFQFHRNFSDVCDLNRDFTLLHRDNWNDWNPFRDLPYIHILSKRLWVRFERLQKQLWDRKLYLVNFLFTGTQCIRAYGLLEKFIKQSEQTVDFNHKSYYLNVISNR